MYPYGHHYWHWYRRPSRFIWFIIGGATATFWIKHKEAAKHRGSGYCIRAPLQQPKLPSDSDADIWSTRGMTKAINNIPLADAQSGDWTEEKRRAVELKQDASDKLAELSEATLDTVLTTVEVLKAKLAEYRVEREKRQEEERRQSNDPVRFV